MSETDIKRSLKLLPKAWRTPALIIVAIAIIWFSLTARPAGNTVQTPKVEGSVTKVVDGDTINVVVNGQIRTVRMIGIDTPEVVDPRKPVQCFGREASQQTHQLLDGKVVTMQADVTQGNTDKYYRLLRYVYLADGTFINLKLLQLGYAHEYTYNIPYQYQQQFQQAQAEASQKGLGLWAANTCNGDTSN